MAWRGVKKYRVKLSNLKNLFHYHYAFGHFILKSPSQVRARKWPKIVAPAPLASSAAGCSVAVSNDNDVEYLHLADPEISDADDLY